MTKSAIDNRVTVLEEHQDWHARIGWGAISVVAAVFTGLITWYLPKELAAAGAASTAASTAAMTSQLDPIKQSLARVNALLELKQSKNVSQVITHGLDFGFPSGAIKALKAVADQASTDQLMTSPDVLRVASMKVSAAVNANPNLAGEGWQAQLALLNYRTQLPIKPNLPSDSSRVTSALTPVIDIGITGGHQTLDGFFWQDVIFLGTTVAYNGGPAAFKNVQFIRCTFVMPSTKTTYEFASLVLMEGPLNSSISG